MSLLHDGDWDDLVLRIVSPEVERAENSKQEILDNLIVEILHSFEICGPDLKSNGFLSDVISEKVLHEPLQLVVEL